MTSFLRARDNAGSILVASRGNGVAATLLIGAVAAVGVAAIATTEVVGGGEDEIGAVHVELFGAQGLVGKWGLAVAGRGEVGFVAHEKRPGIAAGWGVRVGRASERRRSAMLRVPLGRGELSGVSDGAGSSMEPLTKQTMLPGMAEMRSPGTRMPTRLRGSVAATVMGDSVARAAD
jgi:hypothetical protein